MGRGARRSGFASLGSILALGALLGGGCAVHRTQLVDPVAADAELAAATLGAMAAAPLPHQRQAQIAIDAQGRVFVAVGTFSVTPPDAFHAVLAAPFGVSLIEVRRDAAGDEVLSEAGALRRALQAGRFARLLALWLLGDCDEGAVWQGANGVAVDCSASGPDTGLTWRLWVDPVRGARLRGELLHGRRLLGDYTCDEAGRCVLQDLVHGYALRIVPAR